MSELDWAELCWRLGAAALAGMIVGIDREWRRKAAGMRTHMLVTVASAALMILSASDPRVMQGIVTGIGFIGAGAILHDTSERHTQGVTTAASIWACTVLGIASGVGYYKLLVAMLVLTMFVLVACSLIDAIVHRCKD